MCTEPSTFQIPKCKAAASNIASKYFNEREVKWRDINYLYRLHEYDITKSTVKAKVEIGYNVMKGQIVCVAFKEGHYNR